MSTLVTTETKGTGGRPGVQVRAPLRRLAWCALLAALISVGGYIRIPIPGNPVPVTLQIVFVLLAGALLSPAAAAGSVALFLLAGLAGAPVFAGGGTGFAYLIGPTGGYLIGFLAGAAICSRLLAGRRDSVTRVALAMTACLMTVYACGAAQLALYLGAGPATAIEYGVLPFIMVDAVKVALAASLVTGASSLLPGSAAGSS